MPQGDEKRGASKRSDGGAQAREEERDNGTSQTKQEAANHERARRALSGSRRAAEAGIHVDDGGGRHLRLRPLTVESAGGDVSRARVENVCKCGVDVVFRLPPCSAWRG